MAKRRWWPKKGEEFWKILEMEYVYPSTYYDTEYEHNLIEMGNCFKTEADAERTLERLLEVLDEEHIASHRSLGI